MYVCVCFFVMFPLNQTLTGNYIDHAVSAVRRPTGRLADGSRLACVAPPTRDGAARPPPSPFVLARPASIP